MRRARGLSWRESSCCRLSIAATCPRRRKRGIPYPALLLAGLDYIERELTHRAQIKPVMQFHRIARRMFLPGDDEPLYAKKFASFIG